MHGHQEQPEWVGVDLDPFSDVEDRSTAGQQVVDDPEVDEGVLLDPTVGPCSGDDDDQRHRHHRPREQLINPTSVAWRHPFGVLRVGDEWRRYTSALPTSGRW